MEAPDLLLRMIERIFYRFQCSSTFCQYSLLQRFPCLSLLSFIRGLTNIDCFGLYFVKFSIVCVCFSSLSTLIYFHKTSQSCVLHAGIQNTVIENAFLPYFLEFFS